RRGPGDGRGCARRHRGRAGRRDVQRAGGGELAVTLAFKRAQRAQRKARIGLIGPSGSGKTYTALMLAKGLTGDGGRIAVIDTENNSASLYADECEFDVLNL